MKKLYLFIFLVLVAASLFGQNVEIQGNATITGTVEVMDTILFSDGTELASACLQLLQDGDSDTKIEVEKSADEDIIRFTIEGVEIARFENNRLALSDAGGSVFIGFEAGQFDDASDNKSVYIGYEAGRQTNGFGNVAVGASAMSTNNAGNENVAIGASAGYQSDGTNNVFVGRDAGRVALNGNNNTFIGHDAGRLAHGSGNVLLGKSAGEVIQGSNKLAIANSSTSTPLIYGEFDNNFLRINGTLDINDEYTFPEINGAAGQILSYDGSGSLQWTYPGTASSFSDSDADTRIQMEESADEDVIRFDIAGEERMFLDGKHLHLDHPGGSVMIGNLAGVNDDGSANQNVMIGNRAGRYNINGSRNVYVGAGTGTISLNASGNTFVGNSAGANSENGSNNTFIGYIAGGESEGAENTFVGMSSGFVNGGNRNTFLGHFAGEDNSNGDNNTFLGAGAGGNSTGSSNVFIGANAGKSSSESAKLIIDNVDTPVPFIYGDFNNHKLEIDAWTQVKRRLDIDNNKLQFTNLGSGDGNKGVHFGDNSFGILGLVYEKGAGTFDHKLHFKSYFSQGGQKLMTFDGASGKIGIGMADPETTLHVRAANSFGHVMKIENTSTSQNADGLEININRDKNGIGNDFVTFTDSDGIAGSIEGFRVGEGPNFSDFPGINFSDYIDEANMLATVFDPGSFPYPNLGTLELPSATFNRGTIGSTTANWDNFIDNVLCATNPICASNPANFSTFISNTGFVRPSLAFDEGQFPTWVPGNPPSFNLDAILDSQIAAVASNDIRAIINWGLRNGAEVLSADPWRIKLMNDPQYWSNIAQQKDGGVTYASKGADYAEWLEREDPSMEIKAGQIVGVRAGKISLNTESADQIMVISVMPVVLGNAPDKNRSEDFEKVAFIGQSPVWVIGKVNSGDYIIASGRNDGYGLAVAEEDITIEQVASVVGRAWESGDKLVNLVNMAVGLKTNEMAAIMQKTSTSIQNLEDRITQIEAALGVK